MTDRTLVLKLAAVVGVKLVLIMGLWALFVRDSRVSVSSDGMAHHIEATSRTGGDFPL